MIILIYNRKEIINQSINYISKIYYILKLIYKEKQL